MSKVHVSLEQLQRYNQPGPRYTSYPPANHFNASFRLNDGLSTSSQAKPLSLYFHLPFCKRQCLYCGCTNIVTGQQGRSAEYLEYLKKEIELRLPYMAMESEVTQVQLGGGTPTFLLEDELEQLGDLIRGAFHVSPQVEAGAEIDPRGLTLEKVQALKKAGINRASLGVQDTNPDVQKAIARIQPLEMVAQAHQWVRDCGMTSVNFDLIYGLPLQTVESFDRTLDDILTLSPDRLAVYSYAHIPWIKPFQKVMENKLPAADTKLQLLQLAIEKLTGAGYVYIGMDHFAKPDDAMALALNDGTLQRNFQGYSTLKGIDLHGFGMSSISHVAGQYFQNEKEIGPYYNALDDGVLPVVRGYVMTEDDRIRYSAIMHIMCNLYVDYAALSEELGVDFADYFKEDLASLDDLEKEGLLKREVNGLRVTALGRLFIRIIAMRFDAYFCEDQRKEQYSQTV